MDENKTTIDAYLTPKKEHINNPENNKEATELLYQHGGLTELDSDYYQGECPE
jgi:hypothetical protein